MQLAVNILTDDSPSRQTFCLLLATCLSWPTCRQGVVPWPSDPAPHHPTLLQLFLYPQPALCVFSAIAWTNTNTNRRRLCSTHPNVFVLLLRHLSPVNHGSRCSGRRCNKSSDPRRPVHVYSGALCQLRCRGAVVTLPYGYHVLPWPRYVPGLSW